ncbi:T-box transcription factor TBX20-like isoform X2 [Tachypleus tridentatus]|uniref:T-box transcription factor TBX20-like isoform X2 n=1 Tax=Tachypleus tridentatus TaxID=6853 RepID=UPI003FD32953
MRRGPITSMCATTTPKFSVKATDFSIAAIMSQQDPKSLKPLKTKKGALNSDIPTTLELYQSEDINTRQRYAPSSPEEIFTETLCPSLPLKIEKNNNDMRPSPSVKEDDGGSRRQSEGSQYKDTIRLQKKVDPNINASVLKPLCNCEELNNTECYLENKELWEKFFEQGTEMIITKLGRRMFPTIRVCFSGLNPDMEYAVLLDIVPVDNKRYRYVYHQSSWQVAGKANPPFLVRLYHHRDSPFTGDQLKKQVVSFENVKLTNNIMNKHDQIVLNSMHKYQPRIHLVRRKNLFPNTSISDLETEDFRTFVFPETLFTAVTAYQNQLITKLKIDSNPFAKGFRESSRITEIGKPV